MENSIILLLHILVLLKMYENAILKIKFKFILFVIQIIEK